VAGQAVKPVTPTNALDHTSLRKYWLKPPIFKTRGFATPFS
jgi:hypothetical protein